MHKTKCVQPTLLCFLLMYVDRIQEEARHLPKTLILKLGTQKRYVNKMTLYISALPFKLQHIDHMY